MAMTIKPADKMEVNHQSKQPLRKQNKKNYQQQQQLQ